MSNIYPFHKLLRAGTCPSNSANDEHYRRHSDECGWIGEARIGLHGQEAGAVAKAYDFSDAKVIVDVGGGSGNLLATILEANLQARGTLLEQAHVIPQSVAHLKARRLAGRCVAVIGDFFRSIPGGGDIYLLSHVLHKWNDEKSMAILQNCRRAIRKAGKLLLVEMILPPADEPHMGKLLDFAMLTISGGMERTQEEYSELLSKTGFSISRMIPTASAAGIIEAQ